MKPKNYRKILENKYENHERDDNSCLCIAFCPIIYKYNKI